MHVAGVWLRRSRVGARATSGCTSPSTGHRHCAISNGSAHVDHSRMVTAAADERIVKCVVRFFFVHFCTVAGLERNKPLLSCGDQISTPQRRSRKPYCRRKQISKFTFYQYNMPSESVLFPTCQCQSYFRRVNVKVKGCHSKHGPQKASRESTCLTC